MQDSKLVKIFKSLTPEECKYLRWFVQSDFFNTDPNLLRLYEALAKQYPGFQAKAMAKELLYNKVFAGQAFHDGKWRNLCSKMTKLMEDYLVTLEWQKDKNLRQKLLINVFEKRNIDFGEFKKMTLELVTGLEKSPFRDEDYFHLRMEMQRNLYYQSSAKGEAELGELITEALDSLDSFYTLARLKLENELASMQATKPSSLLEGNSKSQIESNWLFKIYSSINLLHEKNDENTYMSIKGIFFEQSSLIRPMEQKFIIKFLLEFAINQVRIDSKYFRDIFEFYRYAHEQDLLATNGIVTNATFINTVNTAARIGEFKWAEFFINENLGKLESDNRHEFEALGRGFLAFNKKEHSIVIDCIGELIFKDILYQLLAKALSLQSYFELFLKDDSYFNLVKAYALAFEKYVSRNLKIGKKKSSSYLYFIRFVRNLAVIVYNKELTNTKRKLLLDELSNKFEIVERNWLRLKIEGK